ncbi:MAG: hypothetical protein R3208_00750 [Ketobacteraceae bacterium]|nr:hypothetical protein [Ketobacteraceae bacterium]
MTEIITTGILALAVGLAVGYFIRLDMADVTGLSRKAAKDGMKALADELNYELEAPRTPQQQGGLKKDLPGFSITVDTLLSRIQVTFDETTDLRLSSLSKNHIGADDLAPLDFSSSRLNRFFPLRAAGTSWNENRDELEALLLPLVEAFDSRQVDYLYVKDQYLRIGFYHRNYLPLSVLHGALPVLETFGKGLVNLQQQRQQQSSHGNH